MTFQSGSHGTPQKARLRNQRTRALNRRDVAWQIAAPLALAALAVIVLIVLVILPVGAPSRSAWADVSLMLLIVPTALIGLLLLALLGGLIWLLRIGLREVPFFLKKLQDWAALATYRVQSGAISISNVLLSARSYWAGARRFARNVRAIIPFRRTG